MIKLHEQLTLNPKDMTKEEFLALAGTRYDALQSLNELDNFYDYEKKYLSIWRELGREVLESNLGKVPKDRRKKKLHDTRSDKY